MENNKIKIRVFILLIPILMSLFSCKEKEQNEFVKYGFVYVDESNVFHSNNCVAYILMREEEKRDNKNLKYYTPVPIEELKESNINRLCPSCFGNYEKHKKLKDAILMNEKKSRVFKVK